MARHVFGATLSDWAFDKDASSDALLLLPGAVVFFYAAATGGTPYPSLLDSSGAEVGSITTTADGLIPQFRGPEDVRVLWADGGAGVRQLMICADLADEVGVQASDIASLVSRVTELEATAAQQMLTSEYISGAYEPRPATARRVQFIGPVAPAVDLAQERDLWARTVA